MTEYYIEANSFAAPFCSDTSNHFVQASSPQEALQKFAAGYTHPFGLYAAEAYTSSDKKLKGEKPLARWICNYEKAKQEATKGLGCYSMRGIAPGEFEVNDVHYRIPNPKGGSVVG